ncbi:SUN domain-containing protein 1 isoform X8 [Pygocentrus nattereri]|uniref:SUN domain-containing protein 1 isoform X8 n=1 Tax=Pygocentrus nattereri TaxID=42514 RepID=UPI0018919F29|nr:SUN domain-containing protein 1 isoform X8 [Pygocentrus nattereri]
MTLTHQPVGHFTFLSWDSVRLPGELFLPAGKARLQFFSSYSSSALDYEREHKLAPVFDSPRMSRRSLRLNSSTSHYRDDSLLDSSHSCSISYSTGGSVHKENKTLKSRRSRSTTSGSGSLLQTPVKNQSNSVLQAHNSSLHSFAASDASLLSSLLDESCIQERTLIDSVWGLDEDGDLKDRTLRTDRSFTSVNNSDMSTTQTQTFTVTSGYICKDCTAGSSDNRDALPTYSSSKPCSSSSCSYSSSTSALHNDARDGASSPYTTVYSREKSRRHRSGHAGYCGTMNVNELVTQKEHQNLSGPLCDDCKGKQNLKTCTVYTWRSRAQQLLGVLWFLFVFTGSGLLKAEQRLLSAGYFVTRKILSFLYLAAVSPGKAASGAFWWLGTAWYQLVTLMSLLNVFFLTRCLPILRKILLILLLFLLLLALWYWGLSSLWAILPVANKTMRATNSLLSFPSAQTPMDKGSESQPGSGPSYTHHEQDMTLAAAAYSERLTQIEQSLTQLWERVVASGSRQEQRHEEVLSLYTSIRDQLHTHTDRESMGQWVSTLMEQRVSLLRKQLEKEKQQSQQHQEEFEQESQTQKSRLAEVETLLKNLALKTEELQRRQDSEVPSSVSGDVEDASRLTLLAEVRRLEETLESIRTDLQGVMGCKGRCEQLDSLHDTVSEQVRLELRSLLYGREQPEGAELPDSVLQWLSTRFVSNSDLQASLISLERSILHNVSIQLEQMQQKPSAETVTSAVRKTTDEAGLSEENVQLIVKNALKLYSQDRIGLVDYALESGGGSVLSTRCSETYETKTALMSLFGLPLWYFSQSPRVVIQPDVHPGNCWAFRGSHGYLVIRLSMKIIPTAFSLEHIPKTLSPTGNISSAPRNFTVYGLDDEQQEEGQVLGRYVYQEDGEPLQTYPVKENGTNAYQIIELRVLSNWGHPEYTCLYRFRVHGKPTQQ